MRLRIFTMSEKPISSSRVARRKAVGDVVTVCNDPPPDVCFVCKMTRDYNLLTRSRLASADQTGSRFMALLKR